MTHVFQSSIKSQSSQTASLEIENRIRILHSWERARKKFELEEPLKTFLAFVRMDTGCTTELILDTIFGQQQLMPQTYTCTTTAI